MASSFGQKQLGEVHTFISFDKTTFTVNTVTFGMFLWAVRCGFISEADLCGNLKRLHGGLLYQAVSLCHDSDLVDEDVGGFVRCVICVVCGCVFGVYIALRRIRSEWILRLECVCLNVGACLRREQVLCEVIVEFLCVICLEYG